MMRNAIFLKDLTLNTSRFRSLELQMNQVINHNLDHKIVYNPGHDFDLGYKNKSEFSYYPKIK